jgi:hypothetical protein
MSIPPYRIILVHGGIGMHRELRKTKLNEYERDTTQPDAEEGAQRD